MNMQYVYLLWTQRAQKAKENVFKIGKTKNLVKLLSSYEDAILMGEKPVPDYRKAEKILKINYKKDFIPRPDHGPKYFEGDYAQMINKFNEYLQNINLISFETINCIDSCFNDFCRECIKFSNNKKLHSGPAYSMYKKWAKENKNTIISIEKFKQNMEEKYGKFQSGGRSHGWNNITLVDSN